MAMGAIKQRVLYLWWEGLPVSYIARHLKIPAAEVEAIVGDGQ